MTFLAPWSGVLAAAVCLPIIVLLYLLKLRRRPLRVSSTLLWERAVRDLQVNAPFRWLRPSLLLLLQVLALAALCLAAARPAFDLDARSGRMVLVIDQSGSMSATDGADGAISPGVPATRLDQARAGALQAARSAINAGGTEIAVVHFAAAAGTACGYTQDIATIEDALASISPTDQPGDLSAALQLVHTLTADESEDGTRHATVVLYSDGANPVLASAPAAPVDFRYVRCGPPPDTGADNTGVVQVNARRDFEDPGTVRVFARVLNARTVARAERVELTFNGRPAASAAVDVPASTASTPGEATVSFELAATDGGVIGVSLAGGDALAADDTAWMTIAPAMRPRITVVARDESSADRFLLSALRSLPPADLVLIGPNTPVPIGTDLIVYDGVDVPSPTPRIPSISIGASIPGAGVTVAARTAGRSTGVVSWERAHPLLRHSPLDTIVIDPPMEIAPAPSVPPGWHVIAHGVDGPLLATFEDRAAGVRRIVIGFALARSNWGPHYSFPLFVMASADYLTLRGESQAGRWHPTTEGLTLKPAPGAAQITLTGAGLARSTPVTSTNGGQANDVTIGVLDRAGLYEVVGSSLQPPAAAINIASVAESWAWTRATIEAGRNTPAVAASGVGGPRELWEWFVVAALVLLTVEWLLYAWQMRR